MVPSKIIIPVFQTLFVIVTTENKGGNHVDQIEQFMKSSLHVIDNYMPSKGDFKVKKLLRRLGKEYDPDWMSIKRNRDPMSKNSSEKSPIKTQNIETSLAIDANITKDNLLSVLQEMAACETKFIWKKMDPLLWPAFVKHGSCIDKKQCSVLPGMKCKMGDIKTLKVLHWSCKKRKEGGRKRNGKSKTKSDRDNKLSDSLKSNLRENLKCRWKRVNFNVKTKCVCSCR